MAQGSVLSPLLFNIYLDNALRSNERLTQLINRGDLIAYADDLYIHAQDEQECKVILKELDTLKESWGLILNHKKTEILRIGENQPLEIEVIRSVEVAKYLGMRLHQDGKEWIKDVKR